MPPKKRINVKEEFKRVIGYNPHGNNKKFKELMKKYNITGFSNPKQRRDFLNKVVEDKVKDDKKKTDAVAKIKEAFKKYKGERKRFKGSIGVSFLIHKAIDNRKEDDDKKSDWNKSDKFEFRVGKDEFVREYTIETITGKIYISVYREYHSIPFDDRLFTRSQIDTVVNNMVEDLKEKIFKRNYVYKVEIETITQNITIVPRVITPIQDKRMKQSGVLNIDGYDNQEWDTNTNRCVYDYIINRYGNIKGFKKSCTYEKLEEIFDNGNSLVQGVNSWGIRNFCIKFRVCLHALDDEEHRFMHYVPPKSSGSGSGSEYPPMIYRISNGHFYPIPKERIRNVITMNQIIDASSDMTYDHKSKKEKELIDNIVVLEDVNPLNVIGNLIKQDKKLPTKNISACDGVIQSFQYEDKMYTLNNNMLVCKYICENMGITYTGQGLSNILKLIIEECGGIEKSKHNPHTFETLLKAKSNRNHYGLIDNSCLDLMKDGYARDINKCYSSVMYNPKSDWIRFDFNDCWEKYDGKLKLGLYYVITQDTTLFKKSDIYSNTIIERAKATNIDFKIKYQLIPSYTEKKNKLKVIIDKILEYTNNDKSIYKLLINMLSGFLAKTKHSTGKYSINNDLQQIFTFIHKYPDMDLHIHKIPETDYYLYGAEKVLSMTENNIGMYIQILDQANIKLYDMVNQMKGQLICRNVDCAVVYYDKYGTEPKLANSKEWGGNQECKIPQITKVQEIISKDYNFKIDDWKDYNIEDSDDWEKIKDILVNQGGLLLQADAGKGKTYVAKKIASSLDKVRKIAPTNKASLNLKGSTIHKFLNMDIEGNISTKKLNTIKKTIDYIIVDEISMITKELWNKLVFVKQATGVKFLLLGDDKQLPPVECENIKDYFNHPAVKYLCNYNRNILQVVKRYNLELKKQLDDIENIDISIFKFNENKVNIAYTNKTRKLINERWNEELKTDNSIFIPKDDDMSQDMWIYKGLPLICKKNDNKGGEYLNNETFIVDDYDNKNIYISSERVNDDDETYTHKMIVKIDDVMKLFYLNYCTTIHKVQGTTIKEKFTIWDWNHPRMSKKAKYTALSRGVCIDDISIVA
jgi:hypothetical protein